MAASRYHRLDLADTASVAGCVAGVVPVAVYLALPPSISPAAITAVHDAALALEARWCLEKLFGEDLHSAVELNR